MTNQDIGEFNALIQGAAEIYREAVTPERVKIYWDALKDLELIDFKESLNNHIRTAKFFPKPCELRGNIEAQAHEDIALLEGLCRDFIFPEFPASGRAIVEMKLKEAGKENLMYLLDRFGAEIVNQTNPTATRAQMLKAYQAEITSGSRQLEFAKRKELPQSIGGLLAEIKTGKGE